LKPPGRGRNAIVRIFVEVMEEIIIRSVAPGAIVITSSRQSAGKCERIGGLPAGKSKGCIS